MREFKTKKSKETYRRVLESAMHLFSELGYEKTTMRALSKKADLGLGALYYYFPSKESIILRFYEELQKELAEEWPDRDPGPEAELNARLHAFLKFKLEKLEPYRPLMKVLLKEAVDPDSQLNPLSSDSRSALDRSLLIFQSLLSEAQKQTGMARMLWLGHLGVIGLWIHKPDKTDQLVDFFAETAPFLALTMGELGNSPFDLIFE
jgi:AcrR family transcriptional regulator